MTHFSYLTLKLLVVLTIFLGSCSRSVKDHVKSKSRLSFSSQIVTLPAMFISELSRLGDSSSKKSFRFDLTNQSSATVTVSVKSKSCSCIDVRFTSEAGDTRDILVLESGTTGTCDFAVTLTRTTRVHSSKVILKAVFDEGGIEQYPLTAEVPVYEDFCFTPRTVNINVNRNIEGKVSQEIVVRSRFRKQGDRNKQQHFSAQVTKQWASLSPIEASSPPVEMDHGIFEQEFRFNVTACPTEALRGKGLASARVEVSAGFAEKDGKSIGSVPLALCRTDGLIADENVSFGFVDVETQQQRRVLIRSADKKEFRILEGKSDHPDIQVKWDSTTEGKKNQVWVTIMCSPSRAGPINGQVTLTTNYLSGSSVSLKVSVTGVDRMRSNNVGSVKETQAELM